MAIMNGLEAAASMDLRGRLGPYDAWRAGLLTWAQVLEQNRWAGIFQHRHTRKGVRVSRNQYYTFVNPQTPAQTFRRTLFSAGVVLFQGLTPDGKATYNERAKRLHMTGFNLFMREWLANF